MSLQLAISDRSPLQLPIEPSITTLEALSDIPAEFKTYAQKLIVDGEVIIPKNELKSIFQTASDHIVSQRFASVAGLIFYPSVSLISYHLSDDPRHFAFALYAPYCASVHYAANRDALSHLIRALASGRLPNAELQNGNVDLKAFFEEHVKHVRITLGGHLKLSKKISSYTRGILGVGRNVSLSNFHPKPSYQCVNCQSDKAISFYHLNERVQDSAGAIISSRRERYLMTAGMCAFLSLVFSLQEYLDYTIRNDPEKNRYTETEEFSTRNYVRIGVTLSIALSVLGCLFKCNKRSNFLDDIVLNIEEGGSLSSIISEEWLNEYPNLSSLKNFWIYVNGQGGIEYEKRKTCSLRDQRHIILP